MFKTNKKRQSIYLDNASATPVDSQVFAEFKKFLKLYYANPSAIHEKGIEVRKFLESARARVAKILGAHADEVIFTSGATEANNFAIIGSLMALQNPKPHIITTNIEHPSVLEVCKFLENTGEAEVTYISVNEQGVVNPKEIKDTIKKNTVLVSVMYANNEIGTIQPIRDIAKAVRIHNKKNNTKVILHTDATQAVNYLSISVEKLGVDLMSFNTGKIYGPKGVGALYVKRKTKINKIIFGGGQERDMRAGTENLPAVMALAKALEIAEEKKEKESTRLKKLKDYFIARLNLAILKVGYKFILNGDRVQRLPNIVNITIPKIPSDLLVVELSARGISVSEKSACKTGDKAPSHVIKAIRPSGEDLQSLRFSMGRETKKSDIDKTIKTLERILQKLRKWYN